MPENGTLVPFSGTRFTRKKNYNMIFHHFSRGIGNNHLCSGDLKASLRIAAEKLIHKTASNVYLRSKLILIRFKNYPKNTACDRISWVNII